jgi:hypothetical protein
MVIGICIIFIISAVGIMVYPWNPVSSQFYYERQFEPSDHEEVRISIRDFEDTNITISFVDDPTLLYRLNITLYSPGSSPRVRTERLYEHIRMTIDDPPDRIQDITLLLGTSAYYGITVIGQNLNTTITHDNGARLEWQEITYLATGIFRFKLTEDVNFTDEGLWVQTGSTGPDLVILDLNLPAGLMGFMAAPNVTLIINEWPHHFTDFGYEHYHSAPTVTHPFLRLDIDNSSVVASLRL